MSQSRAAIFSFALGEEAAHVRQGQVEYGTVVGRAEYLGRRPAYLMSFPFRGGFTEQWVPGDELFRRADVETGVAA